MRRWPLELLLIGCVIAFAAPSFAQDEAVESVEQNHAESGWPHRQIPASMLSGFCEDAELTDAQVEAATTLYRSYDFRVRRASRKLDAYLTALSQNESGEEQSPAYFARVRAADGAFQDFLLRSQDSLLRDWETILHEGQRLGWPRFERRLRRCQFGETVGGGAIGDSGDLAELLKQTIGEKDLPEGARELIESYQLESDRVIRERQEKLLSQAAWNRSVLSHPQAEAEFQRQQEVADRFFRDMTELGKRQREVNLKYLRMFGEVLEPDDRKLFEDRFYSLNQYVRGPIDEFSDAVRRAIVDIRKLRLDQEQGVRIEAIERSFEESMRALRKAEFEECLRFARAAEETGNWDESSLAVKTIHAARVELRDRTIRALREALSEEQVGLLPPPIGRVPEPDLNFED